MIYTMLKAAVKGTAILGLLLLSPGWTMAQNPDSTEINDLLKEVKTHAVLAEDDALTLESYTRSKVSFRSHATRLNQMKEHANEMIDEFNRLGTLRASGSPWQQEAIDRINPLLNDMATHLTATINHLNDNQGRIGMPPYKEYVKANRELMTKTARLISDVVDYGETKAESESLEKALDLPTTAQESPE
jgi:hypothetical protein